MTYSWSHKFTDSVIYFFKPLLGILELCKDSGHECFRSINIMLRRVVAIHAMFVVRVALNIEDMPLYNVSHLNSHLNSLKDWGILLAPKDRKRHPPVSLPSVACSSMS